MEPCRSRARDVTRATPRPRRIGIAAVVAVGLSVFAVGLAGCASGSDADSSVSSPIASPGGDAAEGLAASPSSALLSNPSVATASVGDSVGGSVGGSSAIGPVPATATLSATSTIPAPAPSQPSTTTTTVALPADVVHRVATTRYDDGRQPLPSSTGAPLAGIEAARRWGIVSVPTDGAGPFPLAIVLHGAHAYCGSGRARAWPCPVADGVDHEVDNQLGLRALTEALARRGFVAVAPGINAEYAAGVAPVGAVTAAIVQRDILGPTATAAVPSSLIDRSRVVVVGHSRGGAVAAVLARGDAARRISATVSGVVMISPSSDTVDPSLLADVRAAVVVGTCDGDTGVDGGEFVGPALVGARTSPVALVMVDGMTHNGTNAGLAPEVAIAGRPGCGDAHVLSGVAQRELLGSMVPDLARSTLRLPLAPGSLDAFDRTRADDRVNVRVRTVLVDGSAGRRRLVAPDRSAVIEGGVLVGFTVTRCPAGISSEYRVPGTGPCHRLELPELVGRPASLHLAWSGPGALLGVAVAPSDVRRTLVLRLWADPLVTAPGDVALDVSGIRDGAALWTHRVAVAIPVVGAASDVGQRRGAVLWSERRIEVDPGTQTIDLSVASPGSGAIDIVGVDLITG